MNVPPPKTNLANIRFEDVRFSYGETNMHFDVNVPGGVITAIVGPSGSGKSTFLNLIAGFETPQAGQVLIGTTDVTHLPPASRPVSMVFQENNLFAHLTVEQNVGLGRSPNLKLSEADRRAIASALGRVGLQGKEQRKPEALSGGERQRVAIARALVRERPVLLLDEAFASLGPALRHQMLDLVRELQRENAMTVLMVTHTPEDALYLDALLLFLDNGRISAQGPAVELLSSSGPEALKHYIGEQAPKIK
ncbi:thiamine ABC transporter ATP-binding protein [Brucella pituitosa]|uniref:thiamine ABC transporter ATP-binding protein n=1 Tax=Brucella pituitosa TaxID=571256 RepID=UPI000C26FDF6|nr:thiamine ABC transporter ATP-binding protein [Brucella pituitosa]MCK4206320.1 thiamine ABC transporter ATP-binding protein [Brucella pituitosa]PJO46222.1 thiamine ABC transporter ATP-binding protein [Brucella pituitosa]PRA85216.1 thiamine ABC transporter ATP-binding protein [Ochrobactrum sp. MYb29]